MNTTTKIRAKAIDAHYYLAKDLDRAIAFYRDVIGLEVAREFPGGTVEFDLADGNTFGISMLPEGMWYPGGGVMFAVDDMDAAVARLREEGITFFTDGAMESPVCHVAWCQDTEGNNFALHVRK